MVIDTKVDYDFEIANRQKHNLEILDKLREYFERHPEIRFIQGLWNNGIINRLDGSLDIEDKYYEEPGVTLRKLTNLEI